MAGTGAYALPINMPLSTKKPLNRKMSKEAQAHFDYMFSRSVELFENDTTGELFSKITDINTGKSEIKKCEFTDED